MHKLTRVKSRKNCDSRYNRLVRERRSLKNFRTTNPTPITPNRRLHMKRSYQHHTDEHELIHATFGTTTRDMLDTTIRTGLIIGIGNCGRAKAEHVAVFFRHGSARRAINIVSWKQIQILFVGIWLYDGVQSLGEHKVITIKIGVGCHLLNYIILQCDRQWVHFECGSFTVCYVYFNHTKLIFKFR